MKVCGLDECGRGSLAGPLVAAGVVLMKRLCGLKDSKKMSPSMRDEMCRSVYEHAIEVIVEHISAKLINKNGIGWANKEVFRRIVLKSEADKFIVDGNLDIRVRGKSGRIISLVRADSCVEEVMAASIVAKVTRDRIMRALHNKYPAYGWKTNMGYGTRHHLKAIKEFGTVSHHRTRFTATALKKAMEFFQTEAGFE